MELRPLFFKSARGVQVYFPWRKKRVRIPKEKNFWHLRTDRNRDLITRKQQLLIKKSHIGIAGLSVGNGAALSLALEGFENFRLSDFDKLEISNLNRLRASVADLGENKAVITAQQIYEINPYAKLKLYTKGLDEKIVDKFLTVPKKINLLVEETDSLELKIKIRLRARLLRIPVISATDNGDNVILDVERFDLEPKRRIFHGLISESLDLSAPMSFSERLKLINKIVGEKYITSDMRKSLNKVGKTLKTWPQLGGTAQMAGAVVCYVSRQICLGKKMRSGKYLIDLEGSF